MTMSAERRKLIESYAHDMLIEHGLTSTRFEWSKAVRVMGQYRWNRQTGDEVLRLSMPLAEINDDDVVLDTIAHEVAHGIAGARAGHGHRWREACLVTGAAPSRIAHEAEVVPPPWVGTCESCGTTFGRHRLSASLKRSAIHPSDGGRITWKDNR